MGAEKNVTYKQKKTREHNKNRVHRIKFDDATQNLRDEQDSPGTSTKYEGTAQNYRDQNKAPRNGAGTCTKL